MDLKFTAGNYHPSWGLVITGGQDLQGRVPSGIVDGLTERNEVANYAPMPGTKGGLGGSSSCDFDTCTGSDKTTESRF